MTIFLKENCHFFVDNIIKINDYIINTYSPKCLELFKKVELHIPDEKARRVGQSVAAASLPKIK